MNKSPLEMNDAPRKCFRCKYFSSGVESWEMPHIVYYECRKRPANENLSTFPFRGGCKAFMAVGEER